MKETFKVFKFDDGTYFEGYTPFEMLATDKISSAYWFGYEGNTLNTDDMEHFKGKFVTVTISDSEDLSNKTIKIKAHDISSQKVLKKSKSKIKYIEGTNMMDTLKLIKMSIGYTEQTIASKIGVGKSTVHDWLNGKKPSKKSQKKIRDFIYNESKYGI